MAIGKDSKQMALVIKSEYDAVVQSLLKKYDAMARNQSIHHSQERLREIQQLLRINDETFQLTFDDYLKLKMRSHIQFLKALTQTVDTILQDEALHEHTEQIKHSEATIRFKELDTIEQDRRNIAFEQLRQLLIDQENEFLLYAMLETNLDVVHVTMDSLKQSRSQLVSSLSTVKETFRNDLRNKLVESDLFKHLTDKELEEVRKGIKAICDDIDARYAYPLSGNGSQKPSHQRPAMSFGAQPVYKNEHESKKAMKKNKKIVKYLKKYHEKKFTDKSSTTLTDLPKLDNLAKEAIKLHEEYASDRLKIEKQIKEMDLKFEQQEMKKQQSLEKANKFTDPSKRERFKKTIERTYSKIESRYAKEKERLQKKREDKIFCDRTITALHPEVFKSSDAPIKQEPSQLGQALSSTLTAKPSKPGERKWVSHLKPKADGATSNPQIDTKTLKGKPTKTKDK